MSNVIEKSAPQHNVAETIAEELLKRFSKETPEKITTEFQRTAKPIVFNKMSIQLIVIKIFESFLKN